MTALARVLVRGEGPLASALTSHLAGHAPSVETLRPQSPMVVLVTRLEQLGDFEPLLAPDAADAVLLVAVWRSWVYVGPAWRPGTPGCPRCLLSRVTGSPMGPDQQGQELWPGKGDAARVSWGPAVPHVVATLVAARLDAAPPGDPPAHWPPVTVYNSQTGEVATHPLVPDSTCATCGPPPRGTLPAFTGRDKPLPKPMPATLRIRPLDSVALASHVSPLGLFRNLRIDLQSPFGACSIELPPAKGRSPEPAMGRASSYRRSRSIAVLEGLERYCGLRRGGRRTTVRAAFRDVAERAIYPPSLGLHPAESYATPGFRYRPFTPDVVIEWVEAHSVARSGVVLVPERAAFWGPREDREPAFFYETSNGCAIGSCVEEAVLHGLLELVERDSFLLTWYRQLQLPEVDLRHDLDTELRSVLRKAELFTGCRFRAFLSTMEHGVPSVWMVAVGQDPRGPAVLAGGGAHPDPGQALLSCIHELTKLALGVAHRYQEGRANALRMLEDPWLVRRLDHHPAVNCLPEARSRFSFLLDREGDPIRLGDVPATTCLASHDLRADLAAAVEALLDAGLDVLVVDQTMPEVAHEGLACVKVLVPGLLPVTFGHANRRTEHLRRLTDPTVLPYKSALPAGMEPGLLPHPFH